MAAGICSFKIEGRIVPAVERVSHHRDLKDAIKRFENGQAVNLFLHYIARLRGEMI